MGNDNKKYVMHIDINNKNLGLIPKIYAHKNGIHHRAFSILIFDKDGNMLIQKRAMEKYHSGGLWSNACCSHQITHDVLAEAKKRLKEELGIVCELKKLFTFNYSEKVSDEMIENETDEVLVGIIERCNVYPHKEEAEMVKWVEFSELMCSVEAAPDKYTIWFKKILDILQNEYNLQKG